MSAELRQQFENLSREEPQYHSMKQKLIKAIQEVEPDLPEDKRLVDHAKKAEGLNVLGKKEDGFTGQMQDLKIMLTNIDQQISEKTGRESNLNETLFAGIFEAIRKQLSEV